MSESERNNTQSAIEAGRQIAEAERRVIDKGGIPVAVLPNDMQAKVLTELLAFQDQRADAPRRLKGTATHQELASFIEHVNRFKDAYSAIFADTQSVKLTAVFNYHIGTLDPEEAQPRWSDHRAVYACPFSAEWKLWSDQHNKWMPQEAFGQFIEDNIKDLANPKDQTQPPPAKLIEMARNLVIHSESQFKREINPSTGEGIFHWSVENKQKGDTKIPKSFAIAIPVFDAGEFYEVECRLRYKVEDSKAYFQYLMVQPLVILRHAFDKIRSEVKEKTVLPLFCGSPEQ